MTTRRLLLAIAAIVCFISAPCSYLTGLMNAKFAIASTPNAAAYQAAAYGWAYLSFGLAGLAVLLGIAALLTDRNSPPCKHE